MTEGVLDEGDGGEVVAGEGEEEEEEFERVSYNTDVEPYNSTLSNDEDITVDSP
ncbi:MAG TPA: hypothetical protein VIP53_06135 [Nitrososphaera sp.]